MTKLFSEFLFCYILIQLLYPISKSDYSYAFKFEKISFLLNNFIFVEQQLVTLTYDNWRRFSDIPRILEACAHLFRVFPLSSYFIHQILSHQVVRDMCTSVSSSNVACTLYHTACTMSSQVINQLSAFHKFILVSLTATRLICCCSFSAKC